MVSLLICRAVVCRLSVCLLLDSTARASARHRAHAVPETPRERSRSGHGVPGCKYASACSLRPYVGNRWRISFWKFVVLNLGATKGKKERKKARKKYACNSDVQRLRGNKIYKVLHDMIVCSNCS